MIRNEIEQAIKSFLAEKGAKDVVFSVERPTESLDHGHYASNAALVAAKALGINPRELATEIATHIEEKQIEGVRRAEVAGPGFVNIFLTDEALVQNMKAIMDGQRNYVRNYVGTYKGKTVMVEYTQPNLFKPFHIGHLMSNTIGEAVSRIVEASGAKVIRANYQGDVGLHVAKAIWGMMQKGDSGEDVEEIGEAYVHGNTAYEEDEKARAEINAINRSIYAKDKEEINTLYNKGREASLDHFEDIYAKVGTRFDHYFFESEVSQAGIEAVKKHIPNVFEESDGAIVFKGEDEGLHTRVFINNAGLPTYEGKEIGLALEKERLFAFDTSLTVTAVEQKEYFRVVFAALSRFKPELAAKMQTLHHGMMQLEGGKMSSRKGNIITGESLLSDTTLRAQEKMADVDVEDKESTANAVAVAAIKYSILKQSLGKNIVFNPEAALSFEGDSGPYLQYTYARTCSLLRAGKDAGITPDVSHPEELTYVEALLLYFPDVVERAARELEPHHITTYLVELARTFNTYYGMQKIVTEEPAASYRLALTAAVGNVLAEGLDILGISVPEKI